MSKPLHNDPETIAAIASRNTMYVGLSCWRCSRFESWEGGKLAKRFKAYPGLTIDDLKRKAVCGTCGERASITRAWSGRKVSLNGFRNAPARLPSCFLTEVSMSIRACFVRRRPRDRNRKSRPSLVRDGLDLDRLTARFAFRHLCDFDLISQIAHLIPHRACFPIEDVGNSECCQCSNHFKQVR